MRHTLLAGSVLAFAAASAVVGGDLLGLELDHVALLGTALGAVLALVPDRSAALRVAGFAAGFALAWIGFVLRAAVLPDSATGRAVAAFVVVAGCAAVCAASVNRIPVWSTFVGVAALVGAYEETYTAAPSQLLRESPTAVTTVLLAAALGLVAASLVAAPASGRAERRRARPKDSPAVTERASMSDLLRTEGAQ